MKYLSAVRGPPRWRGGDVLEVVAGVGEVEALVGEGEVRDDRVGEGDGQRGPVQEGRVDDLAAGKCARGADLDAVHGTPAPAFDDPQPGAAAVRDLRCDDTERGGLPGELSDKAEGRPYLLGPDGEACHDVPAGLLRGAESAAEIGEGVRDAGVEGEPGGAGDDAEGADAGGVLGGEHGCALEAVHDDSIGGGEPGDLVEALPDLADFGGRGEPLDGGVPGPDGAAEQAVAGDLGVKAQELFTQGECPGLGEPEADVVAQRADVGDVV